MNRDKTTENIELYSSDLSAKLATISMNTQIRTKTKIKEIHIEDVENVQNNNRKKIILFGNINGYSVDFIATGNFYKVKSIFKQLKSKLALDSAFREKIDVEEEPAAESAKEKGKSWTEEFTVASEDLVAKVKQLVHETSVRRIVIKNEARRIQIQQKL